MGREARCAASWRDDRGTVAVHLDAHALSVRGAFRLAIPRAEAAHARVDGDDLVVAASGADVRLALGKTEAARWAAALAKPPPSLAGKLDIDAAETRVCVVGRVDDEPALVAALAGVRRVTHDPTLLIVRAERPEDVKHAAVAANSPHVAVWVVYTKGRPSACGERVVRDVMRDAGFVDTKVASVSERLTALRFTRRT